MVIHKYQKNAEKIGQEFSVHDYVSFEVRIGTASREPLENE